MCIRDSRARSPNPWNSRAPSRVVTPTSSPRPSANRKKGPRRRKKSARKSANNKVRWGARGNHSRPRGYPGRGSVCSRVLRNAAATVRSCEKTAETPRLTDESVYPTLVRKGLRFCGAGAFAQCHLLCQCRAVCIDCGADPPVRSRRPRRLAAVWMMLISLAKSGSRGSAPQFVQNGRRDPK